VTVDWTAAIIAVITGLLSGGAIGTLLFSRVMRKQKNADVDMTEADTEIKRTERENMEFDRLEKTVNLLMKRIDQLQGDMAAQEQRYAADRQKTDAKIANLEAERQDMLNRISILSSESLELRLSNSEQKAEIERLTKAIIRVNDVAWALYNQICKGLGKPIVKVPTLEELGVACSDAGD